MLLPLILLAADTLSVPRASETIVFDGRASREEYGAPTLELARAGGPVLVWVRHDSASVTLAAWLPDPSLYWGDDLVISLDTKGDRAAGPMHDDFQWYFRRALDSSVVFRGEAGKWRAPRDDPDWRLGPEREGGGWAVRSASDSAGWTLEFRLDLAYFQEARGTLPGLAVRTFDDDPQGWVAWPEPAGMKHPTEVERRPDRWAAVRLTR